MKELMETITHHYDHLYQQDGKIGISRFTPRQLAHYEETDNSFYLRALCTSGVCFDLRTDASMIRLVYDSRRALPHFEYDSMDLFVDGVLVYSAPSGEGENLVWTYRFETREERRISLYLPFGRIFLFSSIDFGGARVERVVPQKRFLFLGDSITMGNMTQLSSTLYTSQLGRIFQAEALNQSVGGYVYDAGSLDESLHYDPDMIFVAYGTNDYGRLDGNAAAFEQRVRAYYQRLTAGWPQARIIAITPFWRADRSETIAQQWRNVIKKVCCEFANVTVLPGEQLLPHLPAFFFDEKLHPNDLGNTTLAMEIARRLID